MGRTCESSWHRKPLLSSEVAVCYYCFEQFPPSQVESWCDGEAPGQTAICPYCCVDAVVGFDGPVDFEWVKRRHSSAFGP